MTLRANCLGETELQTVDTTTNKNKFSNQTNLQFGPEIVSLSDMCVYICDTQFLIFKMTGNNHLLQKCSKRVLRIGYPTEPDTATGRDTGESTANVICLLRSLLQTRLT